MLIYLFLLQLGLSCSRESTDLSYFGCETTTEYCEEGFILHECRQRYCAQYHYYTDSNGDSQTECLYYDYHYFDEYECLDECCGDVAIGHE
jgi:hypothetical protein